MSDLEILRRITEKPKMTPYEAGRDCALNGANTTNCDFRIFSSPERTREWERGKRDGESEKEIR